MDRMALGVDNGMFECFRDVVQVVTTVARAEDAKHLASLAIERKLAACVQIEGPIESVYRWKGAIACDQEWRLVAKTTRIAGAQWIALLASEHPYEEPEILVVPVTHGSWGYLKWLQGEVDCPRFEFLLYGSNEGPFETDFESTLARLEMLPRMFVELDGSFVWKPNGERSWQIDGMIYDANQRVQYVDLKGHAPAAMWESLFEKLAGGSSTSQWHVVSAGASRFGRQGDKLSFPDFAREYLLSSE